MLVTSLLPGGHPHVGLCIISRARLCDLRVLGTQFTSALILSHQPASVLLEASVHCLQPTCSAPIGLQTVN